MAHDAGYAVGYGKEPIRGYPKRKFEFAILVCELLCTKIM